MTPASLRQRKKEIDKPQMKHTTAYDNGQLFPSAAQSSRRFVRSNQCFVRMRCSADRTTIRTALIRNF